MVSTLAWLDGSERQRRQMRDVLAQFREQGTRDELGLATVRDALSEILFPGTGALQTRARYFFFVPWMYRYFERRRTPSTEIERRSRIFELDLVETLLETGKPGVIGKVAGRNLQRLPSSIYWSGLKRLGILEFPGSQDQFHRRFEALTSGSGPVRNDDEEVVSPPTRTWHPLLPGAPSSFPQQADVELTPQEGEFLLERVKLAAPRSFFAWWLDQGMPGLDVGFPWESMKLGGLPPHLARELIHARNFSVVMYGATILYSCLLHRLRKDPESADALADSFDQWHASLVVVDRDLRAWDRDDLWRCVSEPGFSIGFQTRQFVEAWVDLVLASKSSVGVRDGQPARVLIEEREWQLKKALARFHNARALELWGGASGLRQLDFRWSNAVVIGRDIGTSLGQVTR